MSRTTKTEGYHCDGCDENVEAESAPELVALYQCGECEALYEDRRDAVECCK